MTRRVLITGGFGYLGGRIAVELARDSDVVVRLGSRQTQLPPEWLPGAETSAMDVLDPASLAEAMTGVDAVVHLAAMNENECVANPDKAILVNTLGTLNLLNAAIAAHVERFIYFSTAHIYGAPLVGHITEQTVPRPAHPYAITHRAAEDFVLAAHDQRQTTGIVVRLSNGFGAPTHPAVDRWTLLTNDLCRQAVQTKKMILRSSGLQERDFVALEDVGRAVRHMLGLTPTRCGDGLFNLGGENSLSVWTMTQRIAAQCQTTLGFSPQILRPEPDSDAAAPPLRYDCTKIRETGFLLNGVLEQELSRTLYMCSHSWQTSKQ